MENAIVAMIINLSKLFVHVKKFLIVRSNASAKMSNGILKIVMHNLKLTGIQLIILNLLVQSWE
jgi:hypothetical protein